MLSAVTTVLGCVLLLLFFVTLVEIVVCFSDDSEKYAEVIKRILIALPATTIVLEAILLGLAFALGVPVVSESVVGVGLSTMWLCLLSVFIIQSVSLEFIQRPYAADKVMRTFTVMICLAVSYTITYFLPGIFYNIEGDGVLYEAIYRIQCAMDMVVCAVYVYFAREVAGLHSKISNCATIAAGIITAISSVICLASIDFDFFGMTIGSVTFDTITGVLLCSFCFIFAIRAKNVDTLERWVLILAAICPIASSLINHLMDMKVGFLPLVATGVLVACHVSITEKRARKIREHMEDVALAAAIQQGMLPHEFPEDPRIEVFAAMEPAKEVAGDFYDVYQYDDDTVYLLVADVSGKDVPAALFMSKAKALIREYMKMGYSPHQILTRVNKSLCEDNEEMQFVTVWLGRFSLKVGSYTYASAGHNPPVIVHEGKTSFLKSKPKLMLGLNKKVKYKRASGTLVKDDRILVYTDGVTEAANEQREEYGEGRLLAFCEAHANVPCEQTVRELVADVDDFTQADERFDDITLLAMRFAGGAYDDLIDFEERSFPADIDHLGDALDFVEGKCEGLCFGPKDMGQISICVDEIFTNVASYAYEGEGEIAIAVALRKSGVTIHFIDEGVPFNPLQTAAPDFAKRKEEKTIGGLGIYMVRDFMDVVSYDYQCGENRLFVTKNLPGGD